MVLYNLLVFAFGAGVWASARGQRARVVTAVALMGYGVCNTVGLLLAPMELRDVGTDTEMFRTIPVLRFGCAAP